MRGRGLTAIHGVCPVRLAIDPLAGQRVMPVLLRRLALDRRRSALQVHAMRLSDDGVSGLTWQASGDLRCGESAPPKVGQNVHFLLCPGHAERSPGVL